MHQGNLELLLIFMVAVSKTLQMDFIGCNEPMQDGYDRTRERIGIPSTPLARVNSSSRRSYRDYYTPRLVEQVRTQYQDDLKLFGYGFERDSQTP